MADEKKEKQEIMTKVIDPDCIIKLKKPLPNGHEEIILDFDKVNGYALLQCEKEAKKMDKTIAVPSLSQTYQAFVASVASGEKVDDILSLGGKDCTAVLTKTMNFLLPSDK